MSRTPRPRRWPGALTWIAQRTRQRWQPPPGAPARDIPSADICPVDQPSFWRIVDVPHGTWMATLDHWQLTEAGSELRLGQSVLRGPAAHDPTSAPARSRPACGAGRCARRCGCGWRSTTGPTPPPRWR